MDRRHVVAEYPRDKRTGSTGHPPSGHARPRAKLMLPVPLAPLVGALRTVRLQVWQRVVRCAVQLSQYRPF
jgi:hypothetical protein